MSIWYEVEGTIITTFCKKVSVAKVIAQTCGEPSMKITQTREHDKVVHTIWYTDSLDGLDAAYAVDKLIKAVHELDSHAIFHLTSTIRFER